jgi:hypothetical protein
MKKFLFYSLIATVVIVITGTLVVFGVFDLQFGQTDLSAIESSTNKQAQIHNQIVEQTHEIALATTKAKNVYFTLSEESNTDELKNIIDKIIYHKEKLTKIDYDFLNEYKNKLDNITNTFLKTITYFEQKEFTQQSIDSFKEVITKNEQAFETAHNNLVEELNTHKH